MNCPVCNYDLTTRGDVINTRARAGAAVVDAREALARIPRKGAEVLREMAAERLRQAVDAYAAARAAEEVL